MPTLSLIPVLSLVAQWSREPAAPLRIWLRTAGYKLRPPCAVPHEASVRTRQDAVLSAGQAGPHQCAQIRLESRPGPLPTIVVGGFVPDATEALYLLRAPLLQQGSVYYIHYPRRGFSTELFLAQLEDLIEEVTRQTGRRPVLMAISFGAGMVLEMLRRRQAAGLEPTLAGLVLVSPVTCTADLLDPAAPKPTTLLGRVIKPYLDTAQPADTSLIEKSRTVFLKMFESGAQNKAALRFLLTADEAVRLRDAVLGTINAIDSQGATERVRALRDLPAPTHPQVLFSGPALILYAEKENAVLTENAPSRREYSQNLSAWFPRGRLATVVNQSDQPVQHASLIFHCANFSPYFAAFYRSLRQLRPKAA